MPWCAVLKRFGGPGGVELQVGNLVELPDGTRLSQLIEQRYVRLATPAEVESAEEVDTPPPTPKKKPTVRRRK